MSKPKKKPTPDPEQTETTDFLQHETLDGETMVSLSPQGRLLWESIVAACSEIAGRPVTGEEIGGVLRKLRTDLKTDDVDFRQPEHLERFKQEIAKLGGQ